MKKVILSIVMLVLFGSMSTFAQNNDNAIIGIAKGALASNCPDTGGELSASVSITGICTVEGFLKKVVFYRVPNCPPPQVCIQAIQTVGSVTLDCDNNVIDVHCGPYIIEL